jgi:hypothetical protein
MPPQVAEVNIPDRVRLTIDFFPKEGRVVVDGPIHDERLCGYMLQQAQPIIHAYAEKAQKANKIEEVPPGAGGIVLKQIDAVNAQRKIVQRPKRNGRVHSAATP